MNKRVITSVFVLLTIMVVILVPMVTYKLDEIEQAVIVQFGKPVDVVKNPGLHFKKPFIQKVLRFDKRLLAWDGDPNEIPTRGREFIAVDTTARWKIVDPRLFFERVKDLTGAQSRLDDIINSAVRDKISSNELVEIVRSQGWEAPGESGIKRAVTNEDREMLRVAIKVGRLKIEKDILKLAKNQVPELGIELIDVRIKRVNYVASVRREIFERMIAERQRIAAQFRAEGEKQAKIILGKTQKEKATIRSEAQRKAEVTRGEADAEAIRIYNEAYSADPDFFAFQRSLESYVRSIGKDATLIIGTDSDYFRFLSRINPDNGMDALHRN